MLLFYFALETPWKNIHNNKNKEKRSKEDVKCGEKIC